MLASDEFENEVRGEEKFWISKGISGVPAMIFNQKYLVTGAQGVPNYSAILRRITGHEAA